MNGWTWRRIAVSPMAGLVVICASAAVGDCSMFEPIFTMTYYAGDGPECVVIGRLNGDQAPDLATANQWSDDFSVLRGAGDGTFAPPEHFDAGGEPRSLAMSDLDGDQMLDMVVANHLSDSLSVLLNQCSPCTADIDGNGAVDVSDLLAILGAWGPCDACPEDIDGNGVVNVSDLLELLADWGPCS